MMVKKSKKASKLAPLERDVEPNLRKLTFVRARRPDPPLISDDAMKKMTDELKEGLDILINCAGYFYGPAESVGVGCEGHLNFPQQLLQMPHSEHCQQGQHPEKHSRQRQQLHSRSNSMAAEAAPTYFIASCSLT